MCCKISEIKLICNIFNDSLSFSKITYEKYILFLFTTLGVNTFSQMGQSIKTKNVPSEIGVENAYLYYNTHSMLYFGNPSNNFKFLLGYINANNLTKDYLFDSFIFTEHFYSYIGKNPETQEIVGYDGIYRQEDLDFYLDKIF